MVLLKSNGPRWGEPAETNFLYYVLTGADGSHSFTADFDEFIELQAQARSDGIIP